MPFVKGKSGNPGGRPKRSNEVRDMARVHTRMAIERLAHWAESDDARASVSAAQAILDRGWGKPTQPISGDDEADQIKLLHRIERVIVDPEKGA